MTGATIVFAPRIADRILDRLPATEAGAMTSSDLMPFFPDKQISEIRRAFIHLYSARIVNRKHVAGAWWYWRSEQ